MWAALHRRREVLEDVLPTPVSGCFPPQFACARCKHIPACRENMLDSQNLFPRSLSDISSWYAFGPGPSGARFQSQVLQRWSFTAGSNTGQNFRGGIRLNRFLKSGPGIPYISPAQPLRQCGLPYEEDFFNWFVSDGSRVNSWRRRAAVSARGWRSTLRQNTSPPTGKIRPQC